MKEIVRIRPTTSERRTSLFLALMFMINLVMDGLPRLSTPFRMQVALLPLTGAFLAASFYFLATCSLTQGIGSTKWAKSLSDPYVQSWLVALFESLFVALFLYQSKHFAGLGYRLRGWQVGIAFTLIAVMFSFVAFRQRSLPGRLLLSIYLATYVLGQVLSVVSFPLTYLRSDMLPVVFWADRALLAGQNPYQHFYVADRIYDFPYLPGTLLAYAPAQAIHLDLRWASIFYVVGGMCLLYATTLPPFRKQVAVLIGLYVLCPYLQYRHELYTQAHYFSLILIFVLMHKRFYGWSAAVFGTSMVISQFSWVIFPFFLLHALRRGRWSEVARMTVISVACALILFSPFFYSGAGSIAHNAVGQWDRLQRPIARPMNLAFWTSYLVRPSHLKWIQLLILSAGFLFSWVSGRCGDLVDTIRWMIGALLVFILLNVLVDGYFYLMLLIPMLVYTCIANGWWSDSEQPATS